MMMPVPTRLTTALILGTILSSGVAHASEVEDLIEQGVTARKAGKDEAALELFRKADAIQSTGRTRAQIAIAEQALGLWVPADADLTRALTPPLDPWVAKNLKALEASREAIRKHLGTLDVRGEPRGAEVWIDGRRVAAVPTEEPLRVEVGRHLLRLTAAGHHPLERSVEIEPNQLAREIM